MAVLEGLQGIHEVEVYVAQDAFRISYDPDEVTVEEIFRRIRGLGYKPSRFEGSIGEEKKPTRSLNDPIPDPVADLFADTSDTRPVFLDFHAKWCAPCRVLERTVLAEQHVQKALNSYRVLKVDTDASPEAAQYFGVVGLPTLIVLDARGRERFRHLGLIKPDSLISGLARAAARQAP